MKVFQRGKISLSWLLRMFTITPVGNLINIVKMPQSAIYIIAEVEASHFISLHH